MTAPLLQRMQQRLDAHPTAPGSLPWNAHDLHDVLGQQPLREAAVLLGLQPTPSGLHVLLTLRQGGLRKHAGQVSLPGGRIDPGDTDAWAAAVREANEEIGLPPSAVQPLGYLPALATGTGFRIQPAVGMVDPDFVPIPCDAEVAEVFTTPLSYLLDRASRRPFDYVYRGRTRPVIEYIPSDSYAPPHRIWGATALIFAQLADRLAEED